LQPLLAFGPPILWHVWAGATGLALDPSLLARVSEVDVFIYIFLLLRTMTFTYSDAGMLYFGSREFTSAEFERRLGTPRGAKLLSELKHRGTVARTARGRYRFLGLEERPDLRSVEWSRVRSVVLSGPPPMAWTGSTAVETWTDHRYTVSPTVYCRIFELAIPPDRSNVWRKYLGRHHVSTNSRKRVGARVDLVPTKSLRVVTVHGEPVVPRSVVLRAIREHRAIYANAEELLLVEPD
jgi:hypothetical protein